MAFNAANLSLLTQQIGGKHRTYEYRTTDSLATVLGSAYFTAASKKGIALGDEIVVIKTDDSPPVPYRTKVGTIASDAATVVVNSAATLQGFFGVSPAAQPSVVAAVATTGVVTTGFGFSTTAQGDALRAAVNSILATLKTLGLMATT